MKDLYKTILLSTAAALATFLVIVAVSKMGQSNVTVNTDGITQALADLQSSIGTLGASSDVYLSSAPIFSTSSVPIAKRSIYYTYGTSSDPTAQIWRITTSTNSGTPWTLLTGNTGRSGFECCNRTAFTTTTLWLLNSTSTNMATGTNANGYRIGGIGSADESGIKPCFNTHNQGIIWGGIVYGISDTVTSTVACSQW